MSATSISQNAESLLDAYQKYLSLKETDKAKSERLKRYMVSLSNNISKKIEELRGNVN